MNSQTITNRNRTLNRPAEVAYFLVEDGIRVAALGPCPYCWEAGHRHAVPLDILPTALIKRAARCNAARGEYHVVMPVGAAS